MIGIGVIGYGYWGPNLVRNLHRTDGCRMVAVSDLRTTRLKELSKTYPAIHVSERDTDVLDDPEVDAVAIAVPAARHFEVALKALQAGKHVLLTKPITSTSEEAMRLIDEAERRGRVLFVDHTFVYTGAVQKMRELVETEQLGRIYYYDSVRVNLGLFQHDVDVVWDLAPHDISILDYVVGARPRAVSATGMSHVEGQLENIAYLTVFFEDNLIAHMHVNWLAPVKIRRTLIGGSRRMIVYDDLEPSEKVKVYDKGLVMGEEDDRRSQLLVGYRAGDMWCPKIELTEALAVEARHFVDCIDQGSRPITDGEAGLRVVRILEAASQSMRTNGRPVELLEAAVV